MDWTHLGICIPKLNRNVPHEFVLESNRLQFASNSSKTNILKELMPLGILTLNQALEVLNLPPVEDGDKRLQTLNVVNAAKADEYQLDEGGGTDERDQDSGNTGSTDGKQ